MPRYYFHLSHRQVYRDVDGLDLPDFASAWTEAVRTAGEMLRNLDGSLDPHTPLEIAVTNRDGEIVGRLTVQAEFKAD